LRRIRAVATIIFVMKSIQAGVVETPEVIEESALEQAGILKQK